LIYVRCWIPPWMTDAEGQGTQKQIWRELANMMEKEQPGCTADLA
jgi:hypothetical protein